MPSKDLNNVNDIRCRRCGRLLMKGKVHAVEIKCPKCGCIQTFTDGCGKERALLSAIERKRITNSKTDS